MTARSEALITKGIMKVLESVPSSWVLKVHGGKMQRAGVPDILFTCPELEGRLLAIEVKTAVGECSKLQDHEIASLDRAGAIVMVARDEDSVRRLLRGLDVCDVK